MGLLSNQMRAGAAGAAGGGGAFYDYQIASSIRNSAAQDGTLKFTAGTPTSRKKFTISYWVKRYDASDSSSDNVIFTSGTGGGSYLFWSFAESDFQLEATGGGWTGYQKSDAKYRDVSAYYHHVITFDSTQSTQADRIKIYVNGELITSWSLTSLVGSVSLNEDFSYINQSGVVQAFGGLTGSGHGVEGADVQLAEIVFNDGQAYGPDSYAETVNGVYKAIDPSGLTFGNNGYWLKMASGAIGTDSSGNGNNFTVANIAAHDVMLDSPTSNSGSNGGNFASWNFLSRTNPSLSYGASTFSEGSLGFAGATGGTASTGSTISMQSGKWYAEVMQSGTPNGGWPGVGVIYTNRMGSAQGTSNLQPQNGYTAYIAMTNGNIYKFEASSGASYGSAFGNGDICNIAIDIDAGKIWWGKNGTWFNSGNPATGAYPGDTFTAGRDLSLWVGGYSGSGTSILNAGSDGTFAGAKTAQGNTDDTGYGDFYYTPKTIAANFLALCSGNVPTAASIDPAETDDNFPKELFFMSEYTGNLSGRTVTTENQADLIWNRQANNGQDWYVLDSTRGITANKYLYTNTSDEEKTLPQSNFTSLGATSVGISAGTWLNSTGSNYKLWMWRANGGTTSSGSGNLTSTHQVDPSGGFSIVKAQGDGGSGDKTITHGLSTKPKVILAKNLTSAYHWEVFFDEGVTAGSGLRLNTDSAEISGRWGTVNDTIMTAKATYSWNSTDHYIYYCFANIEGYIKASTYVGNAATDGTWVHTGFSPSFVLNKPIVAGNWRLVDSQRSPVNVTQNALSPNNANAKDTGASVNIDLLSNGFKMRNSQTPMNQATTYVYLAFSEVPFKYATAK
jgi:hypothetical protein